MNIRYHLVAPSELDSSLSDAWRAIQVANDRFSSPYFDPEFTRLVAEVRNDVGVVIIENEQRIVGFFPHQRTGFGLGKPVAGPLSDYHGVICTADGEWALDGLLRSARLSAFDFNHLVQDDAERFLPHVRYATESPQLDLSAGYPSYVKARRGETDYIAETERLARKCSREFEDLRFTLNDSDPRVLERLFEWKSEQYRRSGILDAFGVQWTRELVCRVSGTCSRNFAGVASSLRVGEQIVAIHVGMRSRNVMHWWFPAYDQKFAKYRVGMISLLRLAEGVADLGIQTLDLGKGDERYKKQLMTNSSPIFEGFVELPSALATVRNLRRKAEEMVARGGIMGSILSPPVRAIRRVERIRRFH
jgi:CelD/BcsL family acetyltransferase involved in cellulose biosynthesis